MASPFSHIFSTEKIATELVKRYLSCDAAHEKELVFALKALKIETDKKEKGDKFDVALFVNESGAPLKVGGRLR